MAGGNTVTSHPSNGLPGSPSEQTADVDGLHGTTVALDVPPAASYRHPVSASDYRPTPVAFPSEPTTSDPHDNPDSPANVAAGVADLDED